MKKLLLAIFTCFPQLISAKQEPDSLLKLLSVAKEDTNKVKLLFSIADKYETSEPEKAKTFTRRAGTLSAQLKYELGVLRSYRYLAYIFSYQAQFDSSVYYNQLSLDIAVKNKDTFNIGVAFFNIGEGYRYLGDHKKGLEYMFKGLRMLEGRGYTNIESNLYGGLQGTYMALRQFDKAVAYGLKAVELGRKLTDKSPLLSALANLANTYGELRNYEESKKCYQEAISLAKELNNVSVEAMCYEGMTDLSLQTRKFADIKYYAEKGLALHTQVQNIAGILATRQGLAVYYLTQGDLKEAERQAFISLSLAKENHYLYMQSELLATLSAIYYAMHDWDRGLTYGKESGRITDSIFTESLAESEASMRVKYETEKKETQIKLQAATIRQKNTLNYILIGGAAALLIISILSYRNYKHRQKLQQQRINELETEKQLTATEAILKGEEQERGRLAKDLHDGLGGMLSGIKYSLNNMKENLIMTPGNAQAFEHSINMLDNSISEMRRVAHNLMPEALLKFGLDDALKDFCNELSRNGMIKIVYQSLGLTDKSIDQSLSVTIYRVIQELLNNIVKHADARQAIVQLSAENSQLTITVEDDGKGMDKDLLKNAHGIGWKNITSRVQYHKGTIHVQSEPGKGTSVFIEFPTA